VNNLIRENFEKKKNIFEEVFKLTQILNKYQHMARAYPNLLAVLEQINILSIENINLENILIYLEDIRIEIIVGRRYRYATGFEENIQLISQTVVTPTLGCIGCMT